MRIAQGRTGRNGRTARIGLAGTTATTALILAACSSGGAPAAQSVPTGVESLGSRSAEVAVTSPAIAQDGTLAVCTSVGSGAVPVFFHDADSKPAGLDIQVGQTMAAELGLEYKLVDAGFASLIPTLQAGQCDVIVSQLYVRPERAEVVDFLPYMTSGNVLLTKPGNPSELTGLDTSLCGHRVGTVAGSNAAELLQKLDGECTAQGLTNISLTLPDGGSTLPQEVIAGTLDAYASQAPSGEYTVQRLDGALELVGEMSDTTEVGMAVDKGNIDLLEALTTALGDIQADGTYDDLFAAWGLQALALPSGDES